MSLNEELNDGFIFVNQVKSRKQKNRRKYKLSENQLKLLNDLKLNSSENQLNSNLLKSKIDLCVQQLNESLYLKNVFNAISRCLQIKFGSESIGISGQLSQIICYGLGNFTTSADSLYQLTLLLSLKDFCKTDRIYIFDPIFTENEKIFLKEELNLTLIEKNEKCIHPIDSSSDQMVMFFMPHCDKSLFNNILWSNWDSKRLQNILIFGNSFERISETIGSKRTAKLFYRYLTEMTDSLDGVLIEIKVENSFTPKQVFNDLSIHGFNGHKIEEQLLQTIHRNEEPIYEEEGDVL